MIERIEHKGMWNLPGSETELSGELKFSPDEGITLELYGTFSKSVLDQSSHEIILGKTSIGEITLIRNWYRSTNRIYNQITIGVYTPQVIIIGKHFNTVEEITFREVSFSLFNLFEWVDGKGMNTDFTKYPKKYSIDYQKPDDILFPYHKDCEGRMTFVSPVDSEDQNNRIELKEECKVSFKYKEKANFEEIILNDLGVFQGFITLSTFEQTYPLKISFIDDDYFKVVGGVNKPINIQCIYQNTFYNRNSRIRRSSESLLRFQDIQDEFPKLIWNWYEKFHEIEPSMISLLDYFIDKYHFDTEKFMNIVRGLESFHRRTSRKNRFSKSELKQRIKSILSTVSLSKPEKEWLKSELQYSNQLNLKERLVDLINTYFEDERLFHKFKIDDIDKFCRDVVNTRNYNTHYSSHLKEKSLTGKELFPLTQVLTGLLINSVLRYIEVDNSIFKDRLDSLLD